MIVHAAVFALAFAIGWVARGYDVRFCKRCDQVARPLSFWKCGVCKAEL